MEHAKQEFIAAKGPALQHILALLKAKDDTSRFAGLSLLRSLLDDNAELRTDTVTVTECWNAVSPKFLRRLLRSHATERRSGEEAKSMVELAVAIIHSFLNLLPPQELNSETVGQLVDPLLQCLPIVGPATLMIALQALEVIASTPRGSKVLIAHCDQNGVMAAITQRQEALKGFGRVLRAARTATSSSDDEKRWDALFTRFLQRSDQVDGTDLVEVLAEVLSDTRLQYRPEWLPWIIRCIQKTILSQPTLRARKAAIAISGSLLQQSDPALNLSRALFDKEASTDASKSFAYFFTKLVLIELRSTIPSLMEQLATPNYAAVAFHLASCFDILSNFIAYLLLSMSDDSDIVEGGNETTTTTLVLPPDQLLKLRGEFSETFSLTLEYLRDRWDSAVTGARGLDPSTYDVKRPPEVANAPRALTWDNPAIPPAEDPIFLASIRAIALWLREDDNDKLHEQALANMDIMLSLYRSSNGEESEAKARVDFRPPVLTLLAALLANSEAAVQQFLQSGGWDLLSRDLERRFTESNTTAQALQAQDLVRCLLSVVESTFVPQSREAWMRVIATLSKAWPVDTRDAQLVEDLVAGYQLATALVAKAPKRLKKLFRPEAQAIQQHAEMLLLSRQAQNKELSEDVQAGLTEVVDSLEGEKD